MAARISEVRPFELDDGSEETRIAVPANDRVEISDEAGNWVITIQDDDHGRAEISVLEGRVTLYT